MTTTQLHFLGAAGRVTGSQTLLTSKDSQILIDCGLEQGGGAVPDREFAYDPGSLDTVVLTHGHLDHVGMVPKLFAQGFKGKIVAHYATGELAQIVWEDTLRLSKNAPFPPFTEEELKQARDSILYVDYEQPVEHAGAGMRFFDAGHILGSSHVEIEIGDKRVLFSGDIGVKNTPIIEDPYEAWDKSYSAVVIESTYGNRTHKGRDDTVAEFQGLIRDIVERRGVLLIPAFAIGRTQEIIYHFNNLVESGAVPPMPVLIDSPMANQVTRLYRSYTVCYDEETCIQIQDGDQPLDFPGLHAVTSYGESCGIARMRPPFVVVAGSGMCTGGRILNHLKAFVGSPNTTVMVVGWQGKGTIGRQLVDGAKSIEIDNETFPVVARTATLNGFSAHADRPALLEWAGNVPGNGTKWFVNHGEDRAAESLAAGIEAAGLGEGVAVDRGVRLAV